jgi:sugar lactone lactonase YvrE
MRAPLFAFCTLTLSLLCLAGCSDDDASSATTGGATSAATSGSGGGGGAGGSADASSTTTGVGGMGGSGGSGAGGGDPCADLAPGPFVPTLVTSALNGSEDIAFDGKGHIAGKNGSDVVLVDAAGQTTTVGPLAGTVYGLRYLANGDLLAALPQSGKVVRLTPAGDVSDFVTGLGTPNGIFPDLDGNVWVTEFGGDAVVKIAPDLSETTVASGSVATTANGVVLDPTGTKLYYTEYQEGRIRRLDLDTPGAAPVEILKIIGAALDGLVFDACGNLYAIDQGNSRLYRQRLDSAGTPTADVELLADFPKNVANAQFGAGAGFDASTLYAAGTPGSVYAVPLGVPGAPVPMPL